MKAYFKLALGVGVESCFTQLFRSPAFFGAWSAWVLISSKERKRKSMEDS